jgi:CRP/FNR family transcriptional regulator, cyclic AMP receptor protein
MPPKKKLPFDAFLASPGLERRIVSYARRDVIFSQGDACDHVMYLRSGAVQLGIVSPAGREAIVATLVAGDFFGEGALGDQRFRVTTARATVVSDVLVLPKRQMVRLLHSEQAFADRFLTHILARNARLEADWSISYSTRARNASRGRSCCWLAMATRTSLSRSYRRSPRNHSPR